LLQRLTFIRPTITNDPHTALGALLADRFAHADSVFHESPEAIRVREALPRFAGKSLSTIALDLASHLSMLRFSAFPFPRRVKEQALQLPGIPGQR
jgi:hypothetical protein